MDNSKTFAGEIINLEKKYWTAMREKDLESAISLTDFPCIVAGANGVFSVDEKQFKEMFNSGGGAIKTFNFDENKIEVRQIGSDTAVVAYKVLSTLSKDGKDKITNAVDTSTWIKRNDKWVCAMHTETELKETS